MERKIDIGKCEKCGKENIKRVDFIEKTLFFDIGDRHFRIQLEEADFKDESKDGFVNFSKWLGTYENKIELLLAETNTKELWETNSLD